LHEHAQLAVGLETGKHTAGVVVVKELSAQLQIELVSELRNAFPDMFRLYVYILVVVKSNFHLSIYNYFLVDNLGKKPYKITQDAEHGQTFLKIFLLSQAHFPVMGQAVRWSF
jgi:hypothetical protein